MCVCVTFIKSDRNGILRTMCCEDGVPSLSTALWNASDMSIASSEVSDLEIPAIGDEESNVIMDTDDPDDPDNPGDGGSLSMESSRSDRVSGDGGIDNNGADVFASST